MREAVGGSSSSLGGRGALAACILATDPIELGGVMLRSRAGAMRDAWIELLRSLMPSDMRLRRVPLNCPDERLLGGLDIAATLAAGRPIAERGILSETECGLIILPMAERMTASAAARFTSALDMRAIVLERDGFTERLPARFGIVAFDESEGDDERPPAALMDRLACHVDLEASDAAIPNRYGRADICLARAQLAQVVVGPEIIEALCATAMAVGAHSLNTPLLALRVTRVVAALAGSCEATNDHAAIAVELVIAPRATVLPAVEQAEESPPEVEPSEPRPDGENEEVGKLEDVLIAAALAAIPPGLLAQLAAGKKGRSRDSQSGRSGCLQKAMKRGRPQGVRPGRPSAESRLSVVETLRAAAPRQRLRCRANGAKQPVGPARVEIRTDDFRIKRLKQRSQTTTIFVVDASGSAALHRLAEAKGAVELLLADCYVRRDQVALISFGGRGAELLLPPTRSLARAKRNLGDLPGGGGTPLAAGIESAAALAELARRRGQTASMVLLTDGCANLDRRGLPGRAAALEDALAAARAVKAAGFAALLIDTSRLPHPQSARLAEAMGAKYFPLPHADADGLSRVVRSQTQGGSA